MAKKSEEVKNGLVDEKVAVENTVVDNLPAQKVELNAAEEEVPSPGHATRAFRG